MAIDLTGSPVITSDMRAVIRSAHLCFAATVTPGGHPNLSPKGTIRVWDDHHLFFLDIASPGTRANLAVCPWMELNVVEQISRRGYRFFGRARTHASGAHFEKALRMALGEKKAPYPVTAVVMLEVQRTSPLISPGYWLLSDEEAMRAQWYERRAALDREFEEHLKAQEIFRVQR